MKLLRYGSKGQEKPGILDKDGNIRDLSHHIKDVTGDTITSQSINKLAQINTETLPKVTEEVRIGPCVAQVGKLIGIGLNYSDHAKEAGLEIPPEPIVFFKATSSICGPNDNIEMPKGSKATDWEVELGVVIGKQAKYIAKESALEHVAGYCIVNDVSERDYQIRRSGQWVKGKSCDTFGPIGPWLVTKDEVQNPQKLDMWLDVNGKRLQQGNTANMAYDVAYLVWYLSQFMSLQPGDIISTGTPPGVGMGQNPPVYMKENDIIEAYVEHLGLQKQIAVQL